MQEGVMDEGAPRKVSYAKKKPFKKGPAATVVEEVVEAPKVEDVVEEKVDEDDDVKDDWDVSDEEEEKPVAKVEEVKDDWDASESEEEEEKAAPAPAKAAPTPAAKRAFRCPLSV